MTKYDQSMNQALSYYQQFEMKSKKFTWFFPECFNFHQILLSFSSFSWFFNFSVLYRASPGFPCYFLGIWKFHDMRLYQKRIPHFNMFSVLPFHGLFKLLEFVSSHMYMGIFWRAHELAINKIYSYMQEIFIVACESI